MPVHKFRGRENYNLNQGTTLKIEKVAPGTETGEGYELQIFTDGKYKETVRAKSKKEMYKLIREYKDYYNTDRAFLNKMELFITNKIRQSSTMDIDSELIHKTAEIESRLFRLLDKRAPLINKKVAQISPPIEGASTTEEIITEAKNVVNKYLADNKNLIGQHGKAIDGEAKSKLYNSLMKWISEFKKVLDQEVASGANIDKAAIIKALSDEFGSYDFMQDGDQAQKAASLFDGGDRSDEPIDISTDDKIQSLVDTLNDLSGVSPQEVQNVNMIAEKVNPSQYITEPLAESVSRMAELNTEFMSFIAETKISGSLEDVFLQWAAFKELDVKTAEVLYSSIEANVNEQITYKKANTEGFNAYFSDLVSSNGVDFNSVLNSENNSDRMKSLFTMVFLCLIKEAFEGGAAFSGYSARESLDAVVNVSQSMLNVDGASYANSIGFGQYKAVANAIDDARSEIQNNLRSYASYAMEASWDELKAAQI